MKTALNRNDVIGATTHYEKRVSLLKERKFHTILFLTLVVFFMLVSGRRYFGLFSSSLMFEWFSYILIVSGILIRSYSSLYIGGRKNDTVVRGGPFSVVRNPLYVGSFIALVGVAMQTKSVFFFCVLTGAFLLYYPLVVLREEGFLLQKFGDAYREYKLHTPRWLPRLSLWHNDESVTCRPIFVLRTMAEGLIFFLIIPLLDGVAMLHASGWLPILIRVP